MRKVICYEHKGRRTNIAWVSFQPDGSVSFGLHDKSYVASRFKEQRFVWNAYNRVETQYLVQSSAQGLRPITNPHFTFHPAAFFHLKANQEAIFEGIADVELVLKQQLYMPWIRAASNPLHTLPLTGSRADGIDTEEWCLSVPLDFGSVLLAVDFLAVGIPQRLLPAPHQVVPDVPWRGMVVRVSVQLGGPQIATLSWFHSC